MRTVERIRANMVLSVGARRSWSEATSFVRRGKLVQG